MGVMIINISCKVKDFESKRSPASQGRTNRQRLKTRPVNPLTAGAAYIRVFIFY